MSVSRCQKEEEEDVVLVEGKILQEYVAAQERREEAMVPATHTWTSTSSG